MAAVGVLVVWVVTQAGTPAQRQARAEGVSDPGEEISDNVEGHSTPPPVASPASEGHDPAFARVGGLTLYEPGEKITAIAYHEASYDDAMEMHPIGHLQENAAKQAFDPPPDSPGSRYLVQGSRGRGTSSTSAADLLMPVSSTVLSPVDGVVRQVKRYRLYGQYPDWRVEIEPTGYPDLRVVMIHLDGVRVRRGDPVSATLSAIGQPRVLPFHSVVNDYVPGGDPHVHLEIKDLAATPG